MVRLSFKIRAQGMTWARLEECWRSADQLDRFWSGWLSDHLYPFPAEPARSVLESWTTLAALAARTTRLRLGVLVTNNAYRHPALLDRMVTTVDHVSGGHVALGIGAGATEGDHAAYGMAWPVLADRIGALDEACAVVDGLLRYDVVDHDGAPYRLSGARSDPKPVQRPRPPFVVGGVGDGSLRVAARWADEWAFPRADVALFERCRDRLRSHLADADRPAAAVGLTVQVADGPDLRERCRRFTDAGASHVIIAMPEDAGAAALDDVLAALG